MSPNDNDGRCLALWAVALRHASVVLCVGRRLAPPSGAYTLTHHHASPGPTRGRLHRQDSDGSLDVLAYTPGAPQRGVSPDDAAPTDTPPHAPRNDSDADDTDDIQFDVSGMTVLSPLDHYDGQVTTSRLHPVPATVPEESSGVTNPNNPPRGRRAAVHADVAVAEPATIPLPPPWNDVSFGVVVQAFRSQRRGLGGAMPAAGRARSNSNSPLRPSRTRTDQDDVATAGDHHTAVTQHPGDTEQARAEAQHLQALRTRLGATWAAVPRTEFCLRINTLATVAELVATLPAFCASVHPDASNPRGPTIRGLGASERLFRAGEVYVAEVATTVQHILVDRVMGAVEETLTALLRDPAGADGARRGNGESDRGNGRPQSAGVGDTPPLRATLRTLGRFLQLELFKMSRVLLPRVFDAVTGALLSRVYRVFARPVARQGAFQRISPAHANRARYCLQYIFGVIHRMETTSVPEHLQRRYVRVLVCHIRGLVRCVLRDAWSVCYFPNERSSSCRVMMTLVELG